MQYPDSEEHDSLTSHDGLLIDLNLNMATPDTFRSPPAPIPYDVVLGRPQATGDESGEANISCTDLKDCRNKTAYIPLSPKKLGLELLKSEVFIVSTKDEEEDACPTCLEGEY